MFSPKKPRERISGTATETPLLTSASTPWSGFLLEKHNAGDRQDICWGWHRAHVSLITKGRSFHVHNSSGNQDFVARAGSVCVFPSGYDETRFAIAGPKFEAIVVELDPTRVEALLAGWGEARPPPRRRQMASSDLPARGRYEASGSLAGRTPMG
jgi:hypothetical protein